MSAPFQIRYVTAPSRDDQTILGAIGYGAGRPGFLASDCPFATADLAPVDGGAAYELITAQGSVRHERIGDIAASFTESLVFGIMQPDENRSIESVTESAYRGLLALLDEGGYVPIRFWNYLPRITADQDGLERYRRFNIGRHEAFAPRPALAVPPVASGVGGQSGAPLIYFLGARHAAIPIENPRQVSAYDYPKIYGPRSPSFSRAAIFANGGDPCLLISGTASIVGHESRHPGDPAAQVAETLENLRALRTAAAQAGFAYEKRDWALKIYVRDPAHLDIVRPAVEAEFGRDGERIYLKADLCRAELLVEIEAICTGGR